MSECFNHTASWSPTSPGNNLMRMFFYPSSIKDGHCCNSWYHNWAQTAPVPPYVRTPQRARNGSSVRGICWGICHSEDVRPGLSYVVLGD
ncbi:hypothetical protein FKM82_024719 [Ascaphus truei]